MLSDYQLKITDDFNIAINNFKKLVPNFSKKQHASLKKLKFYLRLELTKKKINCALEFHQTKWIKLCIELNTKKK